MNLHIDSEIDHKTIQFNGNTIHYFVSGNREGETILCLHSAFGDHRCFDKQIDYFSSKYKIITLDMPGHGLTGVRKKKDRITATPQIANEILKLENSEKVHIIGVSLGSLLAQDFAFKYPHKMLSLTVVGGYNINKEQKVIIKAQRDEIFKWIFKIFFSMDAFRHYAASVSVIDKIEQARFYQSSKLFTLKSLKVMIGVNKLITNRPQLQRTFPLLLVAGEKDRDLSVNAIKLWHKDDPLTKMHIIENAGHCANMDNAEKFNEIVMNFITKKD